MSRAAVPAFDELARAPSVAAFEPIHRQTHCLYAAGSVIWGARPFDEGIDPARNVRAMAEDLAKFVDAAGELRLDAFVIELPGTRYGASVERLAQTTHAVLRTLADCDPRAEGVLEREVEDASWCYAFGGDPLFVNTFAPCYPEGHSRYGFGVDSTFVLIQPRHSFARVVKEGDTVLPVSARHRIRAEYAAHGRSYDTRISAIPFEAWRIVRPRVPGEPPVRWWEAPATFP
jgi:hypothetical protein